MKQIKLCLAFVLFSFQVSLANTYYVNITGNDTSGDGSTTKPWKTLLYAVNHVTANQGHTIQLSAGIFTENGLVEVPLGVNVNGAGIDQTILKATSSLYYNPAIPGYATDKFLLSLKASSQVNGNQTLKGFTIDGSSKRLHGGIYVHYRSNVVIDGIKVIDTNFTGMWLWDVKDSKIKNSFIVNASWGSTSYCSGALNIGNVERVEIDQLNVDESTGYGIKAIGPSGNNNIINLKIHDSRISVHPFGLWNGGSAPNIAIELWQVNLIGNEIYNTYVDNTISLVNSNATPSTGVQTIRVHDNTIDMDTRAHGAGYGVELTIHDAEVDHNYFIKGNYAIANWDHPMVNWNIHHNTFYAIQGTYPGEVLRSQSTGLHNVKFYNNTIEFASDRTMNVIGVYGGSSDNIDVQNNLFINNNTGYSYYPNQFVHTENGAVVTALTVKNNSFFKLPIGTVAGTYLNNITIDPQINSTGLRPNPYYMPKAGSPLINAGANLGFAFVGSAPDIGALEYGGIVNINPSTAITIPANNSTFTPGNSITINATATDPDGTITKVEFFNGTTLLGQDVTAPYSFSWTTVPAGNYFLTVKATDNLGGVTISGAVAISSSATNAPPIASVTSPVNNSTFTAGSSVTINANATDADGTIAKVDFYNGTTWIGQDLTSPYSFVWTNVAAGSYSIKVMAVDNLNAVGSSAVVAISSSTSNTPPVASITSPVNNSTFVAGSSVTINANATDANGSIAKVDFYNGTTWIGQDLTSPYSFVWTNVAAGSYSIKVMAVDNLNAVGSSAVVAISSSSSNTPPVASITSPVNNSTFVAGSSVTINANATDANGSIAKVDFYNGTTWIGQDVTLPYSFVWANVAEGNYSIIAKAVDNLGAVGSSVVVNLTIVPAQVQDPVLIFPNPVISSNFTLRYSSASSQQGQISIFDNASTLVKQVMVDLVTGINDVLVDVSFVYNGPYIVNFQPASGGKTTTRIVITH